MHAIEVYLRLVDICYILYAHIYIKQFANALVLAIERLSMLYRIKTKQPVLLQSVISMRTQEELMISN